MKLIVESTESLVFAYKNSYTVSLELKKVELTFCFVFYFTVLLYLSYS